LGGIFGLGGLFWMMQQEVEVAKWVDFTVSAEILNGSSCVSPISGV
jgi:hypothetical protein